MILNSNSWYLLFYDQRLRLNYSCSGALLLFTRRPAVTMTTTGNTEISGAYPETISWYGRGQGAGAGSSWEEAKEPEGPKQGK